MGTWVEARDKIRRDLWRPGESGVPTATVDEAIHAACMEIESERRWLFLEVIWETVSPVRFDRLSLPRSARQVNWIVASEADGSQRQTLRLQTLDVVRDLASTASPSNQPDYYAVHGYEIFLDCSMIGGRLEVCHTFATPETIALAVEDAVTDEEENVTLALQFQLVCAKAAALVAMSYLKDEAEAARQQRTYDILFDALVKQDDAAREDVHGPAVRPDDGYSDCILGYHLD